MKTFLLPLLLLLPLAAQAEDAVVFMADEADVKAFDQMLAEQQKKDNFGKTVSEKAKEQDDSGNALGQWVREQKRSDKAATKLQNTGQARSAEVRGLVNDNNKSLNSGNNPGRGHGNKNK